MADQRPVYMRSKNGDLNADWLVGLGYAQTYTPDHGERHASRFERAWNDRHHLALWVMLAGLACRVHDFKHTKSIELRGLNITLATWWPRSATLRFAHGYTRPIHTHTWDQAAALIQRGMEQTWSANKWAPERWRAREIRELVLPRVADAAGTEGSMETEQ